MNSKIPKIIRLILLGLFILIVFLVPVVLFFVGTKEPGINLQSAITGNWTFEPFNRLLSGSANSEVNFRESLYRSVAFCIVVAFISTVLALFYTNWVTGWTRKAAIGMSFTLLSLTLLPQTYLILPILSIRQKIWIIPAESWTIIIIILLTVLPICCWILYMMSGKRIKDFHEMCALDRLNFFSSLRRMTDEIKVNLLIIFLLAWALAWGNYLIPFSLGSNDSFTAVVQIATFTSNLGRDWAMICAAGFIVCAPAIFIGSIIGLSLMRSKGN